METLRAVVDSSAGTQNTLTLPLWQLMTSLAGRNSESSKGERFVFGDVAWSNGFLEAAQRFERNIPDMRQQAEAVVTELMENRGALPSRKSLETIALVGALLLDPSVPSVKAYVLNPMPTWRWGQEVRYAPDRVYMNTSTSDDLAQRDAVYPGGTAKQEPDRNPVREQPVAADPVPVRAELTCPPAPECPAAPSCPAPTPCQVIDTVPVSGRDASLAQTVAPVMPMWGWVAVGSSVVVALGAAGYAYWLHTQMAALKKAE